MTTPTDPLLATPATIERAELLRTLLEVVREDLQFTPCSEATGDLGWLSGQNGGFFPLDEDVVRFWYTSDAIFLAVVNHAGSASTFARFTISEDAILMFIASARALGVPFGEDDR
jgi:hypothetical protein